MESVYERMLELYAGDAPPWDNKLPPPEVIEQAGSLAPGRALDIGCGFGRTAIYLAERGWEVDGIDFIEKAVVTATKRAEAAGVVATFHQADITELSFLPGLYQFAIDVGCAHSLSDEQWEKHHAELKRLLAPGARYLLFCHVKVKPDERGLDEPTLFMRFKDGFTLDSHVPGVTEMASGDRWASAWYWFTRA